jgi:hypothetical protein
MVLWQDSWSFSVKCKTPGAATGATDPHEFKELHRMRIKGFLIMASVSAAFMVAGTANANRITNPNLVTNGDFSTGNFDGWTLADTANGTMGGAPFPVVTLFDVNGSGATNAAEFNVGNAVFTGAQEGATMSENIVTGAGDLSFSADIASTTSISNLSGGVFSVLLDGITMNKVDFGLINTNQTDRNVLSFNEIVSAGTHDLEILITRPFTTDNITPNEFVTDVTVNAAARASVVPEPASVALLALGLFGLGFLRRKKA